MANLHEDRDAKELDYVYEWRIQQEHDLIKQKGTGMSDEQVRAFVDGCTSSSLLYEQSVLNTVLGRYALI